MKMRTAFLRMDRTEALEAFAYKKLNAKIQRLTQGPTGIDLTFQVLKDAHEVRLKLKDKFGEELALKAKDKDMYTAINKLAVQVDKQLRRRKDKRLRRRMKERFDPILAWEEQEITA